LINTFAYSHVLGDRKECVSAIVLQQQDDYVSYINIKEKENGFQPRTSRRRPWSAGDIRDTECVRGPDNPRGLGLVIEAGRTANASGGHASSTNCRPPVSPSAGM